MSDDKPTSDMKMHGSIMYMDGFHFTFFSSTPHQPCLNLFLSTWTLDTPTKFIMASFGVFMLGILTEGVASFVRHRRFRSRVTLHCSASASSTAASNATTNGRIRPCCATVFGTTSATATHRYIDSLLHILQALLGYMDMLVIMTLSVELFMLLLAGLGVGYFAFSNFRSRALDQLLSSTSSKDRSAIMAAIGAGSADIPCCEFLSYEVPPSSIGTQQAGRVGGRSLEEEDDGDVRPTTPLLSTRFIA